MEKHIFTDAAHERHAGVGMHVYESGDGNLPAAVHHLAVPGYVPLHTRTFRADPHNPSLVYEHIFALISNGDVLEEYGTHRIF